MSSSACQKCLIMPETPALMAPVIRKTLAFDQPEKKFMQTRYSRLSKISLSHSTRTASLSVVAWLLLTLLPAQVANAQGTVIFDNRIPGGPGIGQTTHIWGGTWLSLIGLGSNDSPSGTTPFAASGMTLIGANGSGGHYGYATTFAQLIGAVGAGAPESSLVPVGQATMFRSGIALGDVAGIVDTLTGNPGIPAGAPFASFEIVAWDNSSGLYPTWSQASVAWMSGLISCGRSAEFTVSNIGGGLNPTPYLNNMGNNLTSFNLPYVPEPATCALAGLGAGVLLAWRRRRKKAMLGPKAPL
jgi:PEP-CTERM motif